MSEDLRSNASEGKEAALEALARCAERFHMKSDILNDIVFAKDLQSLDTNAQRRFQIYSRVAHALGIVSFNLLSQSSASNDLLFIQTGKGNRVDLGRDFADAVRSIYPNEDGMPYAGFKHSS